MASRPNPALSLPHVRPVQPLRFPVSEPEDQHLGQSRRHWELCMLLARLVQRLVTPTHSFGADQFVYWNARDSRRCLAPDVFVKLGVPDEPFDTWKCWERGVPELAVEILSPSDTPELWDVPEKLERYHELGVREAVFFDTDAPDGARVRAWDLIEGDFVERAIDGDRTPCLTLGPEYAWCVAPAGGYPAALRLAKDGVLVALDDEIVRALAVERDRIAKDRDAIAEDRDAIARERDALRAELAALERRTRTTNEVDE